MSELSLNERRRYAKAYNRVESGIWGRDLSKLFEVSLTTRLGDDNTYRRLRMDYIKLVKRVRYLGVSVDYYAVPELSPDNSLIHLHCIWYMRNGRISKVELQDMWKELHGAVQVDLKEVITQEAVQKYVVKHLLKDYLVKEEFKAGALMSRGWLPQGAKKFHKVLCRWANERKYKWWNIDIWQVVNGLYEEWCKYNKVSFEVDGKMTVFYRKGD